MTGQKRRAVVGTPGVAFGFSLINEYDMDDMASKYVIYDVV